MQNNTRFQPDDNNDNHNDKNINQRRLARRIGAGATAAAIVATSVATLGVAEPVAATASTTEMPDVTGFVRDFLDGVSFGSMGTATGAAIERQLDADLHLRDDRTYHYLAIDDGITIDLPEIEGIDVEILPDTVSFPAGEPIVIVVDPTDPYFYVGGSCPDAPADQRRDHGPGAAHERLGEGVETLAALLGEGVDPLPVFESVGRDVTDPRTVDGPDCGIGISANGNIPMPSIAGGPATTGHVVVDGIVPVHPAVELDGSIVARFDGHGLIATGFGTATASVPMISPLLDISVELGDAGVELEVSDSRIGLAVDGRVGVDEAYSLPLFGVPISMPVHGGVEAAMRFGMVDTGASWVVDPTSFLRIEGDVVVADVPLATAEIMIDRNGVVVDGIARVPGLQVEVGGRITSAGATLRGRADVEFSLDAVRQLSQAISRDISLARTNLNGISNDVDARRTVVRAERLRTDRTLADAKAAITQAERRLVAIDGDIARNDRLIAQRRGWIDGELRWYRSLGWPRNVVELPGHLARLTSYNTQIAGFDAANATQRGYRDTTRAALHAARRLVDQIRADLQRANVDDDPVIVGLLAAQRTAADALRALQTELAKVSVSGTITGTVEVSVGTAGVSGRLDARYCDRNRCTTLAGGSVRFGNAPEACVDVFGLGEVCARF